MINFDPSVFAVPQTITQTEGQVVLSSTSGPGTITGPAAGVTISGGGKSGVFEVSSGVTARLSGLTITDGKVGEEYSGGGLDNSFGNVTLTGCTISNNSAGFQGGGLYNDGTTTFSFAAL